MRLKIELGAIKKGFKYNNEGGIPPFFIKVARQCHRERSELEKSKIVLR
jgi:hypothetical protein